MENFVSKHMYMNFWVLNAKWKLWNGKVGKLSKLELG